MLKLQNRVFSDLKSYEKTKIKALLIVFIPLIITLIMTRNNKYDVEIIALVMILSFSFLIMFNKRLLANNASYVIEDGKLYQILHFPNEPGRVANATRAAGSLMGNEAAGGAAAGMYLLLTHGVREEMQKQLALDEDFRKQILDLEETAQISKVIYMKEYHKGYKIKCIIPLKNGRNRKYKFYIFPGYNDYEKLVECLQNLM